MSIISAIPEHEYNETLIRHARPPAWVNPQPKSRYNLLVVGAGSGGLTAAAIAASMGARVALVEKHLMGGDCLNVGCVPSKAIIRAAKAMADIRHAAKYGIHVTGDVEVNFEQVMAHVWRSRAHIAPHDSAERYANMGVDVFFGAGRFTAEDAFSLDGQTLRFSRAILATGSRPSALPIDGLAETGFLTNESLWNVTTLPARLAILGAGPIGVEMAQAFQRLGTDVTLIDIADRILPREDPAATAILSNVLEADGVTLRLGARTHRVWRDGDDKVLELEAGGGVETVRVDEILVAAGRTPNLEDLGLDAAGVAAHPKGVTVDDHLQTTNRRIYAVGDIASPYQFTHVAGQAAIVAVQNALFSSFVPLAPKRKFSRLVLPWATFTDPEIAHVGLTVRDADERGIAIDVFEVELSEVDRSVADNELDGFAKVITRKGKDEILGATIVARHGGEIINQVTQAMTHGIGLRGVSSTVFAYPTASELFHKVSSAYTRTRLTPLVQNVARRFFGWTVNR